QLSQTIQVERMASLSNTVMAATSAANTETARLLTAYSGTLDTRRAEDQRTVQVALQVMDTKVARLRAELETVAVNTWDGFQQTHQNLAQLASYSIPVTSQQ
ncbi:MAG TPA: hypothetical protein VN673_12455, partial [Clostridia bacterium]|nr:hypothetical protein [Clostridia bacterium]